MRGRRNTYCYRMQASRAALTLSAKKFGQVITDKFIAIRPPDNHCCAVCALTDQRNAKFTPECTTTIQRHFQTHLSLTNYRLDRKFYPKLSRWCNPTTILSSPSNNLKQPQNRGEADPTEDWAKRLGREQRKLQGREEEARGRERAIRDISQRAHCTRHAAARRTLLWTQGARRWGQARGRRQRLRWRSQGAQKQSAHIALGSV